MKKLKVGIPKGSLENATIELFKKSGWRILRKDISAHTLRHSFATRMIDEGKSIKGVSKYLGHSNVSTTLDLYVHSELDWEALEDIAEL